MAASRRRTVPLSTGRTGARALATIGRDLENLQFEAAMEK
jgi:hypothetical protein